jgi:predicted transcriptional regulator
LTRQYHRRPDAKRVTLSVPVSEDIRDRLWVLAAALQRTPTDIAREAIEKRLLEAAKGAAA